MPAHSSQMGTTGNRTGVGGSLLSELTANARTIRHRLPAGTGTTDEILSALGDLSGGRATLILDASLSEVHSAVGDRADRPNLIAGEGTTDAISRVACPARTAARVRFLGASTPSST